MAIGCEERLQGAFVSFDGRVLIAGTGRMQRCWVWGGKGFITRDVELCGRKIWHTVGETAYDSDWQLPVCDAGNPVGILQEASAFISDDEGFTTAHVAFKADIVYPEAKLLVRFSVWVYPDAPGLRTSLHVKAMQGYQWDNELHLHEVSEEARRVVRLASGARRIDLLPLDFAGCQRRMFGYYSDTQNRNDPCLDILLEAVDDKCAVTPRVVSWANAVCMEDSGYGIAILKESHKCVNQSGHDTGEFVFTMSGAVESHGWGVLPAEIDDEWHAAWASWCIVYESGERSRQEAFKRFDKIRYPINDNDIGIQANTWGSSQGWLEHREAAAEQNVLNEIDHCSDMGIEIFQIDDGWQGNDYAQWFPDSSRYPEGWNNVRQVAAQKGVKLGLWMAALPPTLEDMQRNYRDGGFVSFKLDFAELKSRSVIDSFMHKVRTFIQSCEHKARLNWDLTEVTARYGYYFAREYGCIYLENRKPVLPRSTTYRPATVLRDLWQIAHYCNLLKFQGTIQNIDMVNNEYSDASAYSHAYCVAITLMSSPLFFCETAYYSQEAREEIRPVLQAYKRVRDRIYSGIVYPIGSKPDGTGWTGFECVTSQNDGILLLLREPGNTDGTGRYHLPDLCGRSLELDNLLTGLKSVCTVSDNGEWPVSGCKPGDFLFMSYRVKD